MRGTSGESSSSSANAARYVIRSFRSTLGGKAPDVYAADCKLWDPINGKTSDDEVHFILPWEVVKLQGSAEELSYLPDSSPFYTRRLEWGRRVGVDVLASDVGIIPMGLWGDSAPCTSSGDSVYLLLWNSLSSASRDRNWIVAFSKRHVCECGCQGRCTFDSILKVVVWIFEVLLTGVAPYRRHDLVPFENSKRVGDRKRAKLANSKLEFKGALLQKRGDWAWLKQLMNLHGWKGEGPDKRMCWLCRASITETNNFRDAALSAAWRATAVSDSDFMRDIFVDGTYVSQMWNIPGFVRSCVSLDLMHVGDLGIVLYFLGNVLYELFVGRLGGYVTNPTQALGELKFLIRLGSKHVGLAQPALNNITLPMLRGKKSDPKLKCKAAEARNMLKVVTWILTKVYEPTNAHEHLVLDCLLNLNQFYELIATWPKGCGDKVSRLGRGHVILYAELSRQA